MKIEVDGGTRLALMEVEILLLSSLESKRYSAQQEIASINP
jgi:hypothetical protein